MAIDIAEPSVADRTPSQRDSAGQPLRCALSGRTIDPADAYWAPPLVTARDLVSTIATTLVHTPGNLGHILFSAQPDVPYASELRDELAARRSAEQLKLLVGMLVIAALIAAPLVFLALR